jgi:hypothetical protein
MWSSQNLCNTSWNIGRINRRLQESEHSKHCYEMRLTRWDDTVRLALPVGHLSAVVDDDIAGLTDSVGADDSLHGDDLANVGLGGLEGLEGNVALVEVRVGLKEGEGGIGAGGGGLRSAGGLAERRAGKFDRTRRFK